MRAAVYHGRQDLRLEEVPEPVAGPGEVKLKVLYNGICGSDLHEYYDGPITTRTTTPPPLTGVKNPVILGHELCGEVVDVGDGVEELPPRAATVWRLSRSKPAVTACTARQGNTITAVCWPSMATTETAADWRSSWSC